MGMSDLLRGRVLIAGGICLTCVLACSHDTQPIGLDQTGTEKQTVGSESGGTESGEFRRGEVNAVLDRWSAGYSDDAFESFLAIAEGDSAGSSLRVYDLTEEAFVSLTEDEQERLGGEMVARFVVVRRFTRDVVRYAGFAKGAGDVSRADRLLRATERFGEANTGVKVTLLADLVGKAVRERAKKGLAELPKVAADRSLSAAP